MWNGTFFVVTGPFSQFVLLFCITHFIQTHKAMRKSIVESHRCWPATQKKKHIHTVRITDSTRLPVEQQSKWAASCRRFTNTLKHLQRNSSIQTKHRSGSLFSPNLNKYSQTQTLLVIFLFKQHFLLVCVYIYTVYIYIFYIFFNVFFEQL